VREGKWEEKVRDLLEEYGLDGYDVGVCREDVWKTLVARSVAEEEERRWRAIVESKSKLRTYQRLKKSYGFERYLDLEDGWVRRRIARLRAGTVELRVETGRWKGESVEERVCAVCGVVEDESHFIEECECGRLARGILMKEIEGEGVERKEILDWVLGGFARSGLEWGVVVGQFLRRLWEARGGLENGGGRRKKNNSRGGGYKNSGRSGGGKKGRKRRKI